MSTQLWHDLWQVLSLIVLMWIFGQLIKQAVKSVIYEAVDQALSEIRGLNNEIAEIQVALGIERYPDELPA